VDKFSGAGIRVAGGVSRGPSGWEIGSPNKARIVHERGALIDRFADVFCTHYRISASLSCRRQSCLVWPELN
jgi:hypothetical protein